MSFAFPALVIILIALPGIILRYAYLRGYRAKSTPFVVTSLTDEVAYGLFNAIVLNVVWCWLASRLHHAVDLRAVLGLLIGSYDPHSINLANLVRETANAADGIVGYFLSLYVASALLGFCAHEIVRWLRLDHRFGPMRFPNEWYYLLSGEYTEMPEPEGLDKGKPPDVVFLSTVVVQGGTAYLYRGYIVDYFFDRQGNFDRVVLCGTKRRRLDADRTPTEQYDATGGDRFYDVVGDRFIVRYSEMQTINIEGLSFEEMIETDSPAGTPIGS